MAIKRIARNKKAFHNYEILEQVEAGMVLQGTEIKSIRESKVTFTDSFAEIKKGEIWLVGFHISLYTFGNRWNHDETRKRKLLLHRREILKLHQKIKERGFTLVPLDIYMKDGKAKMTIGLVKGKALYDKRTSLKQKDQMRDLHRDTYKYR